MLTRIFLVITFMTLIILVCYVFLNKVTNTITKEYPTMIDFNEMNQQYPNTVQCPCKTYSIEYEQLITFEPRLHLICSSQFIEQTSEWLVIDYPTTMLDNQHRPTYLSRKDDFRQIASSFFQLLSSFCKLSNETINAELKTFYSDRFITLNLITSEQFQTQINHKINQFINNTARSFIDTLFVVENMTAANMLFSALSTDSKLSSAYPGFRMMVNEEEFYFNYIYDEIDQEYNSTISGFDCDCQQTPWCVQQTTVYALDTVTPLFSPSGEIVSVCIYRMIFGICVVF